MAFARSIGLSAALVRRLVPSQGGAREERRPPPPRDGGEPPKSIPGSTTLERRKRYLTREIARLDSDLERAHVAISTSSSETAQDAADVERLIRESRSLQERLRLRRDELVRLNRHIARERKLSADRARAESKSHSLSEPGRKGEKADRPIGTDDHRYAVAQRILDRSVFDDRSEAVVFRRSADALFAQSPDERREAVERLATFESGSARKLLRLAADDSDSRIQLAVLKALVGDVHPKTVALFERFLRSSEPPLRVAALRGLVSVDSASSEVHCLAALEDGDPGVRKSAVSMLGWGSSDAAVAALLEALTDPEAMVRAAAATALGAIGHFRVVYSLIRHLGDESKEVRRAAELALRAVIGNEDFDTATRGAEGEDRIAALKAWWRSARVDKSLLPREPAGEPPEELPEPDVSQRVVSEPAVARAPRGPREAPRVAAAARSEPAPRIEVEEGVEGLGAIGAEAEEAALESIGGGDEEGEALESIGGGDEEGEALESIGGGDEEGEAFESIGGGDEEGEAFESIGVDENGAFEGIGEESEAEAEEFEDVFGGDE